MPELVERRVVVTGLGAVSPLGIGRRALVSGVRAGRSGIGPISRFDATGFERGQAGEVRDFTPAEHLREPYRWGRAGQFAAAAARQAVADARIDPRRLATGRTASVFGTTNGEAQVLERITEQLVIGGEAVPAELTGQAEAARIAVAVAAELDLTGETLTFGTACAAGNYAIGHAFDLVRGGEADAVLCGGADVVNRATHAGFHRLGALATGVPRPFDRNRDGIVTAEGAAVLLLEPLDAARARGARIYAEVLGYGMTCDARHMTNPDPASIAECIRQAQRQAGVKPDEVDYICAHGTGTRANEVAEVAAVREVFGARIPPISSAKAVLGHTMGAAAAFGALLCCAALAEEFLPPTATLRELDPALGPGLDCVPGVARPAAIRIAQNHGFAFGGNNAITIFGRWHADDQFDNRTGPHGRRA